MTTQSSARNVLLVGGDEEDQILIRSVLDEIQGNRYSLYWYKEEAPPIHLIRSKLYDIVLLAYENESYCGIDLIKIAREQCLAVILLTDWNLPDLEQNAIASGASVFLRKSNLTKDALVQILAKFFE